MSSSTDRIVKSIVLRAPLAMVWSAVSDAVAFGTWFGVRFDGPFVAGTWVRGVVEPTSVDAEVAKAQAPHAGKKFEFVVARIEAPTCIAFQWHPFAVDPDVDYSDEPMTDIVFELREVEGGTELTITESGFDRIPLARRAKAFEMNSGGWAAQTMLLSKYLARRWR